MTDYRAIITELLDVLKPYTQDDEAGRPWLTRAKQAIAEPTPPVKFWTLSWESDAGLFTTVHRTERDVYLKLADVSFPMHHAEDASDVSGDKQNYDAMIAALDVSPAACSEWFDEYNADIGDQVVVLDHEYPFDIEPAKPTIITISGGVGDVAQGEAFIIDFDNLNESLKDDQKILLDPVEVEYIQRTDPEYWAKIKGHADATAKPDDIGKSNQRSSDFFRAHQDEPNEATD